LSLLFMFFTPIIVLLLFDIDFATSKVGIGLMAGYFLIGVFFDAFGRFTGKISNAPAYWLTIFLITTLFLVTWKSAFPNNYTAHKVEWKRTVDAWTAHKDRKSFPTGLDGSATYTQTTAQDVFCFYKSAGNFAPARQDTNKDEHLKLGLGTEVAVVNHGTTPEMWGEEQMVLVRLKNPITDLFTGKTVWVPSRFLDSFQSPLDYRPGAGDNTGAVGSGGTANTDTTSVVIQNQGEWIEVDAALHKGMYIYVHAPYNEINGKFSWGMLDGSPIKLQPIYQFKGGGWCGRFFITEEPNDPNTTRFFIQVPEAIAGYTVRYWIG